MTFSSILNHFTENDLVPQEFGFARLHHIQLLLDVVQVEKRCGAVWNNPSFPKLFTRLFSHTAVLDPALLLLFLYHGTPKVAKSLNKTYVGQGRMGWIYGAAAIPNPERESQVPFQVGKYRCEQTFRGYNTLWRCKSVRFVKTFNERPCRPIDYSKRIDEGKCRLWYQREEVPNDDAHVLRYIIIDYYYETVFHSDLARVGRQRIRDLRTLNRVSK